MTPEDVFECYRAYKFHYAGTYDYLKYRGKIKSPALIDQRDRTYFHRIANRLTDPAIHALFMYGFFFSPKAHISELATTDMLSQGLVWSGRIENGYPLLKADVYKLTQRIHPDALDNWLYGAIHTNGTRDTMPGCVRDIIGKRLPIDLAASLLLVPIPERSYAWITYWEQHEAVSLQLGPFPWITRLQQFDMLLHYQWAAWRTVSYTIAHETWAHYTDIDITPIVPDKESALF